MFTGLIDKLQRRVDLTVDEAADAMETIMDGRAQPSQMAGFLIGLAMKGERPAEIVGLARTMRARAVKLSRSFDWCSTRAAPGETQDTRSTSPPWPHWCWRRLDTGGQTWQPERLEPLGSANLFETLGVEIADCLQPSNGVSTKRASRSCSRRRSIRR